MEWGSCENLWMEKVGEEVWKTYAKDSVKRILSGQERKRKI